MKWIVPGPNTKVLAQAVHCLAKLGEDLYIEGKSDRLSFRTVNMSKTAFASFRFNPDFFSYFPVVQDNDALRCQISMKAALIVFRFPSGMEKSVENCAVSLQPAEDSVEVRIKFKQGFVKTNKIQLLDSEVLQASYEDETLPSAVIIEPKILAGFLTSFSAPEITWAISENGVQFRNFSELCDDGDGLRSEVYAAKDELLSLRTSSDTELTFCLGELKTVMTFAEQVSCPIALHFHQPGKPVFFMVHNEILTAHVVLSTLGMSSQSTNASQGPNSQERIPESQESVGGGTQRAAVLKQVLTRGRYDITKLPGYDEILAPDSDDESMDFEIT